MWGLTIFVVVILVNYGCSQGPNGFQGGSASRDRGPDRFRGGMQDTRSGTGMGGMEPTRMQRGQAVPFGECPQDRRIDTFTCGGSGSDNIDCPTGSQCMRVSSGQQICCWNDMSTVSAPCDDPMMRGNEFVTCSSGERGQACPGSCHDCQTLQGVGTGLCCPQVTRRGCSNSSPMRNEFEASRRRIQGMGSGGGGSTSGGTSGAAPDRFGAGGMDRGSPRRDDRFSQPRVGVDFGMTRDTGARVDTPRRECPGGGMSTGSCAQGVPCGEGQVCMAVSRTSGVCCVLQRQTPFGMPGVRTPFGPGVMGRGMMMRGIRGVPFQPRGPFRFGGARPPFMGRRPMF